MNFVSISHFVVFDLDWRSRSKVKVNAWGQGQSSRSRSNVWRCILHYACAAKWSIYGLGLPSAKENHRDTWNTVQDLCVFISNQDSLRSRTAHSGRGLLIPWNARWHAVILITRDVMNFVHRLSSRWQHATENFKKLIIHHLSINVSGCEY